MNVIVALLHGYKNLEHVRQDGCYCVNRYSTTVYVHNVCVHSFPELGSMSQFRYMQPYSQAVTMNKPTKDYTLLSTITNKSDGKVDMTCKQGYFSVVQIHAAPSAPH